MLETLLIDSIKVISVVLLIYILVGLTLKFIKGRTVSQYSPLDIVSLFIFAGLIETTVVSLSGKVSPESFLAGACFIILFHNLFSSTAIYRKLFPLKRYILIKNGTINSKEISKAGISEDHLWIELRKADIINITQVKEASLEANGDFSIVKSESAKFDPITGLEFSWSAAEDWILKLFNSGSSEITCLAVDFCDTGKLNKEFGEKTVNKALKEAADLCSNVIRYDDRIYRFEEDRFFLVLNVGLQKRQEVVENLVMKINMISSLANYEANIHMLTVLDDDDSININEIVKELNVSIEDNPSNDSGKIFCADNLSIENTTEKDNEESDVDENGYAILK